MVSDKLLQALHPLQLQQAVTRYGASHVSIAVIATVLTVIIADYVRMLWLRSKMPPGPLPLPIIGNTHMLPDVKPWFYFEELSKKYNTPLITFWIGRNPTVWINEAWAASELFDKRAAIYCSRPRMVVFGELGGGQKSLVSMYARSKAERETFRTHRKLMHLGVGIQKVKSYRSFQNDESKLVAYDCLRDPEDYVRHLERYATSVVSIIGFGRRVASPSDPLITDVIDRMHLAADLNVPGKTFPMLMETFPILAKFPNMIAPWKKGLGSRGRRGGRLFFWALADEASNQPGHEEAYAKMLIADAPKYGIDEEEISSLTGNIFGAGSDTSSSTLITFVLACCAFPESLPRAWEELDRVVDSERSPHFDDKPNLPYVTAFVSEVFRWRSVAIIGGQPHAPVEDDVYNGWLIPQGTWIQGNVWAIHRNEREFPEPDRFNPCRFLKGHADNRPFPGEKGYMAFGWGRRVCSGQALAEQGTWITVARLLWAFKIARAKDQHGKEIPVDIFNYTNGLNWRPKPFKCNITPRSDAIRQTIEREGKQARSDLAVYDGDTKYRLSTFYLQEGKAR